MSFQRAKERLAHLRLSGDAIRRAIQTIEDSAIRATKPFVEPSRVAAKTSMILETHTAPSGLPFEAYGRASANLGRVGSRSSTL